MRQTQKKSPLLNQTLKNRKFRIQRNRIIAKQRYFLKHPTQCCQKIQSVQDKGSTKQERAHIQKLKNRQAAQKSRQQKKQHIKNLQFQIKSLKLKIASLKYCQNCRKQLKQQFFGIDSLQKTNEQNSFQSSRFQASNVLDSNQQIYEDSPIESTRFQSKAEGSNQQQYEYIRENHYDDNSSIGIYLFIGMIMLGVICLGLPGGVNQNNPMRRELIQLSLAEDSFQSNQVVNINQIPYYQQNHRTSYSTNDNPTFTNEQDYQNALLTLDKLQLPLAVSDTMKFKAILSSLQNKTHNHHHLRTVRNKNDQRSIMFCGKPRLYSPKSGQNTLIKSIIDIFIVGNDIQHFVQGGLENQNGIHSSDTGIYKVTAQVFSITKIDNNDLSHAY